MPVRMTAAQLEALQQPKTGSRKPQALKLTENDVEKQICDFLKAQGWFVLRHHVGTFRTLDGKRIIRTPKHMTGCPDWSAERSATVKISTAGFGGSIEVQAIQRFYFEVKAPGKRPSNEQLMWMHTSILRGIQANWSDCFDGVSGHPFLPWYKARFE